ncbi:hypothetical protein RHSIM_Rhsim05G0227700 [Rhododendron simsii]|uniref:Uncharacterized protein n=1 Tax=Rhododendron simsii TaxID=118357 RepID=A0A834GUZ4_RHOSS|nr:hypothetical protein RHSIM_Rhsim05G0227700 [Rhododendron simsii]
MPRSRYRPPSGNPAAIVSPQFCAPYSVDLTILGHRRTLLDAAGNPILTLQRKMHKKLSVQGLVLGKDNFAVTVFPNVDYAFIVALVVVLEEINNEDVKG